MTAGDGDPSADVALGSDALSALMPMHVVAGSGGRIGSVGRTLARIAGDSLVGRSFFKVFDVTRPRAMARVADLRDAAGTTLHLGMRTRDTTPFRAVAAPLLHEGGVLLNLSFGIHVSEAVAKNDLTIADFAATDLAVEMLYLLEAKSAAMEESRKLNLRLETARHLAEENSRTDPLTGLPNRRGAERVMSARAAEGARFAVMAIDLDHFKAINDSEGHAAGDAVLAEVARRLLAVLGEGDMVARIGGDEFLAIIVSAADRDGLTALGDELIAALSAPIPHEGKALRISASVGIALVADPARSRRKSDAVRLADEALYASKRAGRGRVTIAGDAADA